MLFGYPNDAPDENLVHDLIVAYLEAGIDALNAGGTPPRFKAFMPNEPPELARKTNLKNAFNELWRLLEAGTTADREAVRTAVRSQADLPDLLRNAPGCAGPARIPANFRQVVGAIFRAGFELLTATGVRDRVWAKIRAGQIDGCFCAFCGLEQFEVSPNARRPEFDHYLASTHYEAARANLRNLAPIGGDCNRIKGTQDIIRDDDGTRRPAFYPYEPRGETVSLAGSRVLPSGTQAKSKWVITLGDDREAVTWDAVFKIKERYEYQILKTQSLWWRNLARTVAVSGAEWTPVGVRDALIKVKTALCFAERPAERRLRDQQFDLIIESLNGPADEAELMTNLIRELV